MIAVLEDKEGALRIIEGNPVLLSLDGERQAPLATILHESWTEAERLAFGVHLVEIPKIPRGKTEVGAPVLEKVGGRVVMRRVLADAPKPDVETLADPIGQRLAAIEARLAVIEGRR
jgi:hypothetical protein